MMMMMMMALERHAASRYSFWRRLFVCLSAQSIEKYWSEIDVTL